MLGSVILCLARKGQCISCLVSGHLLSGPPLPASQCSLEHNLGNPPISPCLVMKKAMIYQMIFGFLAQVTSKQISCSRIRETLNLLTWVDISPDTQKFKQHKLKKKVFIFFNISCVTCHMSPTLTPTATDPPPADSPTMHNEQKAGLPRPRFLPCQTSIVNQKTVFSSKFLKLFQTSTKRGS